jgi:reactive intermediate/imine deaminase
MPSLHHPNQPSTHTLLTLSPCTKQHRTIQNLSAILQAADSSLEAVFKVNVFLSDMSLFTEMNEAYKQYWGDMKPSRTCVAVKQLPLGTDVEIECQAVIGGKT